MTDGPRLSVVIGDDAHGDDLVEVLTDSAQEAVKQPAHGVRADSPGPRGCWALKRDGSHCGAARRAEGDYCNAHSGLGVAENPEKWSVVAAERSAISRRRRAALRLELGITRPTSIRGMLKAGVWAERERVVAAALDGLDDPSPKGRHSAALALLDAVDPQPKAALQVDLPTNPEGVEGMGLAELRALAEQVGITPTPPLPLTG